MSTLRATNIKNPDSSSNNIVLDGSGGVVISGVTTSSSFVGNVTGDATGLTGTPNLNVGVVTASSFVGNVTGNATGLSGTPNIVLGIATVSAGSTSAPSITPSGDNNTGVFFPSADTIAFAEGGTEVARFDSSGRLGIGTVSPQQSIDALGAGGRILLAPGPTANEVRLLATNTAYNGNAALVFGNFTSELGRFDTSGRLLVGTNTAIRTNGGRLLQIKTNDNPGSIVLGTNNGTIASGTEIGAIEFSGTEFGTTPQPITASIVASGDAGWTHTDGITGSFPTRLVFSTTASGASSPTEQLRITSDRYVRLASGTGGIQFGGDTAAANALDDYEEGTWTPRISGVSGGDYTPGGNNYGWYRKIGSIVYYGGTLNWTARVTPYSGNVIITGLPFSSNSVANNRAPGAIGAPSGSGITFTAGYTQWTLIVDPSSSFAYIIQVSTDGGSYSHTPNVGTSGIIYGFGGMYATS
jgi:hypothetical protein